MTADRWLLLVVAIASLAYVAVTPRLFERLDPITGDEPFYVMTALSLTRDHDLDESNNYTQRDYDELFPRQPLPEGWLGWDRIRETIEPHAAVTDREGVYTKHGLGLPLLIAVPFEAFERTGAVAVIALAAVALAGQTYLLARQATSSDSLAATVALGLVLTLPIVPYTHLLFPEIPAALCLLYAVRRVASTQNSTLQWLLAGTAIGFLPWLHQRFVPTACVLALFVLVRLVRNRHSPAPIAALVPILIGGVSLIGFNLWLYGAPVMPAENHDGFNDLPGTVNGAFGLLLDAQWGLFVVAPLALLAVAAIPWWVAADRETARVAVFALTPYLLLLAAYSVWWGAWGPPARYLVPVVPFAAGPLAAWLSRVRWPVWAAAFSLWSIGATLTLIGLVHPQRFYHQPTGHNNLVETIDGRVGTDIADRLVAFQTLGPSPLDARVLAAAIGSGVMALCFVFVVFLPRRQAARRVAPSTTTHQHPARLAPDRTHEMRAGE